MTLLLRKGACVSWTNLHEIFSPMNSHHLFWFLFQFGGELSNTVLESGFKSRMLHGGSATSRKGLLHAFLRQSNFFFSPLGVCKTLQSRPRPPSAPRPNSAAVGAGRATARECARRFRSSSPPEGATGTGLPSRGAPRRGPPSAWVSECESQRSRRARRPSPPLGSHIPAARGGRARKGIETGVELSG